MRASRRSGRPDEMYGVLKVSWFPIVSAVFTFGLMTGIVAMNFSLQVGAGNRTASTSSS